jgi:hypothetical protein
MKYRASAVITFEFEADNEGRKAAVAYLNAILPANFEFSVSCINATKDAHGKIVVGEFGVDEVLPYATKEYSRRDYASNGVTYSVRMNSQRYWTFRKSLKCAACGLEGKLFRLEYAGEKGLDRTPHFNLYGEENGELILMTKDHIVPKSKNGPSEIENYQTMCAVCNMLKGSLELNLDQIKELRDLYNEKRRGLSVREFNRQLAQKKFRMLQENRAAASMEGMQLSEADAQVIKRALEEGTAKPKIEVKPLPEI